MSTQRKALMGLLQDGLLQFDALLKRKSVLLGEEKKLDVSPSKSHALLAKNLSSSDVRTDVETLQRWLCDFTDDDSLGNVLAQIVDIFKKFAQRDELSRRSNTHKPSTKDSDVTIDDIRDDSVEFTILETIRLLLERAHDRDPSLERLADSPLFAFCFDLLSYTLPHAIRHAAAASLGVLSRAHLSRAVGMFIKKADAAKKDAALREYASYQQQVRHLAFSFAGEDATTATIAYFKHLETLMQRVERGVLRAEVCHTVESVLTALCEPWERFDDFEHEQPEAYADFSASYGRVYDTIAQWSQKSKHTLFCHRTMFKMVCLGSEAFHASHADVVARAVACFKKNDLRLTSLEQLRDYVSALRGEVIKTNTEVFTEQMTAVRDQLWTNPKQLAKNRDEQTATVGLLTALGRKHVNFFVNEVCLPMLEQRKQPDGSSHKPPPELHRSLVLRALGNVAQECAESVGHYDYALGPIVAGLIDSPPSDLLLKAALRCFPFVRQPDGARAAATASSASRLTLHDDREISTSASQALQQFVLLDPAAKFIPSVFYFVDLLCDVENMPPEQLLRLSQTMTYMFDSVKSCPPRISPQWRALRHHVEALALMWLAHPEGFVRNEITRVVSVFVDDKYRDETKDVLLADVLLPKGELVPDMGMEQFSPKLLDVLRFHYDDFRGVFAWAWQQLAKRPRVLLETGTSADNDWYVLWKNHIHFLCLALRARPKDDADAGPTADSKKKKKKEGADVDDDAKIREDAAGGRSSLGEVRLFDQEINAFIDDMWRVLHMTDAALAEVLHQAACSLAQVHRSCFELVAARFRDADFTQRNMMELLARLVARVKPAKVHVTYPAVYGVVTRAINHWTKAVDEAAFKRLSDRDRTNMAAVLERFLVFTMSDRLQDEAVRELVLANRAMYFYFLKDREIIPSHRRAATQALEIQAVRALVAMIKMGAIHDPAMEDELLELLHSFPQRGAHLFAVVDEAMLAMLEHNPHRLRDFVKRSSTDVDKRIIFKNLAEHSPGGSGASPPPPPPRAERSMSGGLGRSPSINNISASAGTPQQKTRSGIARSASIVLSFDRRHLVHRDASLDSSAHSASILYLRALVRSFIDNSEHWTFVHKVRPATILAVSLMFQCSADRTARLLALELAQTLQTLELFDPGMYVPLHSHESPFMYNERAIKYSAAIAQQPASKAHMADLFEELVELNAYASDRVKEMLLRVAIPWAQQLGPLLGTEQDAQSSGQVVQNAQKVLTAMFTLTRQCHGSSILTHLLHDMWQSLFHEPRFSEVVVPEVVEFFVYMSIKATYSSDTERKTEEALLKMVFVHLSRSSAAAMIAAHLLKEFRVYFDQVPSDPTEFFVYEEQREDADESVTPSERSAFVLLANIVYEQPRLFKKHWALLLQTTLVLFQDTDEGRDMLTYVGLGLGLTSELTEKTATVLLRPAVKKAWTKLAFVWAVNACDEHVAARSFSLFSRLHKRWVGNTYTLRLALTLFWSLQTNHSDMVVEIVDIFKNPAGDGLSSGAWQMFVAVGVSLLEFERGSRLRECGMSLLRAWLCDATASDDRREHWLAAVSSVFCPDEKTAPDEGVVQLVRKDVWSGIEVLSAVAKLLRSTMMPNNHIMCLLLMLRVASSGDEASAIDVSHVLLDDESCAQLRRLFEAGVDEVEASAEKKKMQRRRSFSNLFSSSPKKKKRHEGADALVEAVSGSPHHSFVRAFFRMYSEAFPERHTYDFMFSVLHQLLDEEGVGKDGEMGQGRRPKLLVMLAHFLDQFGDHMLTQGQFDALGELLTQCYFFGGDVGRYAAAIVAFLVENGMQAASKKTDQQKPGGIFNFCRHTYRGTFQREDSSARGLVRDGTDQSIAGQQQQSQREDALRAAARFRPQLFKLKTFCEEQPEDGAYDDDADDDGHVHGHGDEEKKEEE